MHKIVSMPYVAPKSSTWSRHVVKLKLLPVSYNAVFLKAADEPASLCPIRSQGCAIVQLLCNESNRTNELSAQQGHRTNCMFLQQPFEQPEKVGLNLKTISVQCIGTRFTRILRHVIHENVYPEALANGLTSDSAAHLLSTLMHGANVRVFYHQHCG